ncbi:MAG: B12-binding domain-containing radical SAM protein [Desulfococcaceae bacterium]
MKPRSAPRILLVNPWIHDFAAYDFWARPLGLLTIAAVLREHGIEVDYLDCLDRFHPKAPPLNPKARHGRGPYLKTRIPRPDGLTDIPRHFCRYGIDPAWFTEDLQAVPEPDLILVTSLMTYWYPGVQETIQLLRQVYPEAPILLGGIYATLCRDHAETVSGADRVIPGNDILNILDLIAFYTGYSIKPRFDSKNPDAWPDPALDLQHTTPFAPLLTSRGCPFACAYCASRFLEPKRRIRSPERVMAEIRHWHEDYGVQDFVFYDDALLVHPDHHIIPLLKAVIDSGMGIRFHTPNAVHIREVSGELADLMRTAGFETLRLGLETAAFEEGSRLDRKVTEAEFKKAIGRLLDAGFDAGAVGAYLLAGLPDQTLNAVAHSIGIVRESGVTPVPAYYTPIPHTDLWDRARAVSRYDLAADPVFTNNALLPCWPEFSWEIVSYLKNLASGSSEST